MKRAEYYQDAICEVYNAGKSVDQIGKELGIQPREVRAGVYLGIQQGKVTAFLPGVVDEAAEIADDDAPAPPAR